MPRARHPASRADVLAGQLNNGRFGSGQNNGEDFRTSPASSTPRGEALMFPCMILVIASARRHFHCSSVEAALFALTAQEAVQRQRLALQLCRSLMLASEAIEDKKP